MKIIRYPMFGALAALVASTQPSSAVVGQALQIQGTNLVLSWPSQGYEHYLIQTRPTLDPTTPWTELTNNYPANGTNTSFTIYGVVAPPASGGGSGGDSGGPPSPMSATTASGSSVSSAVPVWVAQGRPPYPWELEDRPPYPWEEGAVDRNPPQSQGKSVVGGGSFGPLDGGSDPPSTGFYRVFHIPDFTFDVTAYTYHGPTFFPSISRITWIAWTTLRSS